MQMLISSKMQISDDVLQHTQILDQNKLKPSIELKRQAQLNPVHQARSHVLDQRLQFKQILESKEELLQDSPE